MRTNSRRRGWGLVLAMLTLLVSLPELAYAQQTGLFPLSPIRRQRVPCDQQDPIYRTIKQQYYGYHPTCWRRFPAGWGCPSPEAPDKKKSFEEIKLQVDPLEGARRGFDTEGGVEAPVPRRPEVPAIPNLGRDPFEQPIPAQPGNPPGAAPGGQRTRPDPFELDKLDTPPAAPPNAPRAGRARQTAPAAGGNGPELSAPAEEPDRKVGSRTSRSDDDEETDARPDGGPLLAIPNVNLPPVSDSSLVFGTRPAQGDSPATDTEATPATTPGSSAPRRGFLSSLFNNLGWNWTRR
jgi:hypothetical protein